MGGTERVTTIGYFLSFYYVNSLGFMEVMETRGVDRKGVPAGETFGCQRKRGASPFGHTAAGTPRSSCRNVLKVSLLQLFLWRNDEGLGMM